MTIPNDPDYGDAVCWPCPEDSCKESPCPPPPCPPTNKSLYDQYKVVTSNVTILTLSIRPGVGRNPGRQSVVFTNLNSLVTDTVGIRVHPSGSDPTVPANNAFIQILPGGGTYELVHPSQTAIIKGDICLVNISPNTVVVSIAEVVGLPELAPTC